MTILISITVLAGATTLAYLVSHGLPESLRAAALQLLRGANHMDEWRAKRDVRRRTALARVLEA